jgi:hypothetical protein
VLLASLATKHSLRDGPAVISPLDVEGAAGTVVVVVGADAGTVVVVVGADTGTVVVVVGPLVVDVVDVDVFVAGAVAVVVVVVGAIVVDVVAMDVVVVGALGTGTVKGAMMLIGRPTFFPNSVSSSWFETERQSNSTE